ncbi:MAG: hypothetical protein M1830_009273 [Pleopsidium flavum]|nr:MAG: hypothetical protein M1830_009273 [Pleopsidium flavum]
MAAEVFASSIAISLENVQDGIIAAPAVVLPHCESRQPQPDVAVGAEQPAPPEVDSSGLGNFGTTSISSISNKNIGSQRSEGSTSGGSKGGVTKALRLRGTRGRGDPRNARMLRARVQAHMERYENASPLQSSQDGVRDQAVVMRGRGRSTFHEVNETEAVSDGSAHPANDYGDSAQAPRAPAAMRRTPQQPTMINIHGPPSSTGRRGNVFRRPPPHELPHDLNGPLRSLRGPEHRRPVDDWSQWVELGVKLFGLPSTVTTFDLWKTFSKEGSITTIEIFEDSKGERDGKGRVRFSPPPAKPFWQTVKYPLEVKGTKVPLMISLELDAKRRLFLAPSPVNQNIKYPECTTMHAESIDFGFMYNATTMMAMSEAHHLGHTGISFSLNLLRREIDIQFQLKIVDPRIQSIQELRAEGKERPKYRDLGKYNRYDNLRFRIPLAQLQVIREISLTDQKRVFLISLEAPPNFYRKTGLMEETHEVSANFWNQWDAWYRQTDILYSPKELRSAPLTLKKSRSIIDIGRWTTYRFIFDKSKNDVQKYNTICAALRDYNIEIMPFDNFTLLTDPEPAVWGHIDRFIRKSKNPHGLLKELTDITVPQLSFPVRYQLEVCISQGCLNEHNLTKEFVDKLADMEEVKAKDLLEYVASQKQRCFDPRELFEVKIIKGSASRLKIPHYCAYTRSATVTPTTVYYHTPTVETSNRVVRQYIEHADRFLRVRFSDEKFQGRINATEKVTMNEVFTRIKRTMINGITIGDRHFEFLAFGNSQFREHGAYFFAPLPHLTAQDIRTWMGYFRDIKIVAKHAARLGQCFSTTRAINCTRVEIREIMDIERNGYTFTDGVGKISNFLAQLVTSELNIITASGEPPSVFQFRLGGCKGVLAVSPDAKMREIHIRPSQYKFPAMHNGLEIIRWSQFAAATLNRQLILVLSALGVGDDVFVQKLKEMLLNLEQAMTDEKMALYLLQKYIDPNQMTMTVAGMILEGFQHSREPFVTSLLQLWRAWSIKYLKEKAKIMIEKGAFLFGCIDETASLKGHFNSNSHLAPDASYQDSVDAMPQIFLQISARKPGDRPLVIEGPCLLARNPSLHPGDIRVVNAVNVPALWHLKDVVVLPQTGDRDISSMCSGGDLDGDDYLVIWDPELYPKEWNHKPMDYTPPKPMEVEREITVNDITNFFVTYMKNDRLPTIAHAHLALGDYMDLGVKDEKCLRLADLHSMAVDYVKTGEPARMPSELNPRKWPHFMEKNHKPKEQIYVSHKVLGKLYDQVERIDFVPYFDSPFDKRILTAYDLDSKLLWEVATLKEQYDAAMHRIMAQHDIGTEFEVWSTFVLHHAMQSKDYKFHEEMGEISSALKDRFRQACYDKAGSKDYEVMGPFVAAMYRVTAEEMAYAVEECRQVRIVGGKEMRVRHMVAKSMPLMSFPWLFQGILGKIASGEIHSRERGSIETPIAVQGGAKRTTPKKMAAAINLPEVEDTLETTEGLTHRGEILELFHHDEEQPPHSTSASMERPREGPSTGTSSAELVTKADGNADHFDPGPNPTADEVLVDLTLEECAMHEESGLQNQGADFGTLVDIDGDDAPAHRTQELVAAESRKSSIRVNDLLGDDGDVEQFNIDTACQGGDLSSDTALGTPAESDSTEGSISNSEGTLIKVYHDKNTASLAKLSLNDSKWAATTSKSLLDEDDDEQGEEVTIRLDSKDSALESLAKLVG